MTALDLDAIRDRARRALALAAGPTAYRVSKEDIPALVAEVERLEGELAGAYRQGWDDPVYANPWLDSKSPDLGTTDPKAKD